MLSRTAENLYWLARYVERAEYLARTIEATLRVTALPNTYIGQTNECGLGTPSRRRQRGLLREEGGESTRKPTETNVVEYLSFSTANPSLPIRNCIEAARLNSPLGPAPR